jgi:hypothetical protein
VFAFAHTFEQRRGRAAGHVGHGDLHRFARAQGVIVHRGERIAALGRRAFGGGEVHLDELSRDVIQRRAIIAHEGQMTHRGRNHATGDELERKVGRQVELGAR